jgi:hypothetical protein
MSFSDLGTTMMVEPEPAPLMTMRLLMVSGYRSTYLRSTRVNSKQGCGVLFDVEILIFPSCAEISMSLPHTFQVECPGRCQQVWC